MTQHLRRVAILAACALTAAACKDSTGADGTPSAVTARAYVDADGSGSFSQGDVPIAGARITLVSTDGSSAAVEATTGADGTATFADVEPGTYELAFAGNVPAGAVLSTAVTPTVVAPFEGGQVNAEFRFAFRPGSLSGVIYRDDNGNGTFNAGTDTPAPGIPVRLFAGTSATGTPVAETVTTDAGAYSFTNVRPGTYTVQLVPGPAMQFVGGNTFPVTIGAEQAPTVPVRFTGELLTTIALAKQRPQGSTVVVDGIVTANQGVFGSNAIYIQDATSGIQVFRIPATVTGLVVGDSVRVRGGLRNFGGELQLDTTNATAPERGTVTVTRLGTGVAKTPRLNTGAQINARTFEGELLRVNGFRVTVVGAGTTTYNVTGTTPDGQTITVRVAGAGVGIPRTTWVVGNTYDVIGVLGSFSGAAQLKPRGPADVIAR